MLSVSEHVKEEGLRASSAFRSCPNEALLHAGLVLVERADHDIQLVAAEQLGDVDAECFGDARTRALLLSVFLLGVDPLRLTP